MPRPALPFAALILSLVGAAAEASVEVRASTNTMTVTRSVLETEVEWNVAPLPPSVARQIEVQVSATGGPWVLLDTTVSPTASIRCTGDSARKTCTISDAFGEFESVRVIQRLRCLTYSNSATTVAISGSPFPPSSVVIKQHDSPFTVAAAHAEEQLSTDGVTYLETVRLFNPGNPFSGKMRFTISTSGADGVTVGNPTSDSELLQQCPPAGCETNPFTLPRGESIRISFPVRIPAKAGPVDVRFGATFPSSSASNFTITDTLPVDQGTARPLLTLEHRKIFREGHLRYDFYIRNRGTQATSTPIPIRVSSLGGQLVPLSEAWTIDPMTGQLRWTFDGALAPASSLGPLQVSFFPGRGFSDLIFEAAAITWIDVLFESMRETEPAQERRPAFVDIRGRY